MIIQDKLGENWENNYTQGERYVQEWSLKHIDERRTIWLVARQAAKLVW